MAARVKIYYSIQTNTMLLDDAWCELIKRYPLRTGVSIDGPAFIHDAFRKTHRGGGTHARTLRGIEKL